MKNVPEKIYLQIEGEGIVDDFNELEGVTHCTEKINESDLVYISKKGIEELIEKYEKNLSNAKWYVQGCLDEIDLDKMRMKIDCYRTIISDLKKLLE